MMPALPSPIAVGQKITAAFLNALLTRLSSLPSAVVSGVATVTIPTANTPTTITVTFPAGSFTSPPNVIVSPQTGAPAGGSFDVAANGITASQFTLQVQRSNTTTSNVQWAAFGS